MYLTTIYIRIIVAQLPILLILVFFFFAFHFSSASFSSFLIFSSLPSSSFYSSVFFSLSSLSPPLCITIFFLFYLSPCPSLNSPLPLRSPSLTPLSSFLFLSFLSSCSSPFSRNFLPLFAAPHHTLILTPSYSTDSCPPFLVFLLLIFFHLFSLSLHFLSIFPFTFF